MNDNKPCIKGTKAAENEENEIRNHIHRQIQGKSDQVRSKEIWQRILAQADPMSIANALSEQLTHFNYQEVPSCKKCNCCC